MKTKTLLTILCVCFSINLHSQEGEIIYTDFEPDTVIVPLYASHYYPSTYENQIPFDINYDNIYDISFYYGASSDGKHYTISSYLSSEPNPYTWYMRCYFVELNDTISNIQFDASDWDSGLYWNKISYVAMRHELGNGDYCYAWMRAMLWSERIETEVSQYNVVKVIIYDMAYCTVPNYPLRVGQKSFDDTSICDTSESKDYVLFPSPANDKITLKFNNHYYNTTDNEIKIYGIDGRLLKTQNSDFDNIDISNLTSGVHIMKIYLGNGENYTEKFVKE
ncbi:MAG: T9SS type A sorting domain-containing protein [Bacteroidales bacterium]|nr:T9SS type A sorting domain-containing protein [Bacteroidales bacterium]